MISAQEGRPSRERPVLSSELYETLCERSQASAGRGRVLTPSRGPAPLGAYGLRLSAGTAGTRTYR